MRSVTLADLSETHLAIDNGTKYKGTGKLETDKQGSERGVKLELERITIAQSANFVRQSRWFYPWSRFKYLDKY